jgi:methyl-galactoside transport system ATP-binding protein
MADITTEQPREWLLEMNNISKSFPGVKAMDNVN